MKRLNEKDHIPSFKTAANQPLAPTNTGVGSVNMNVNLVGGSDKASSSSNSASGGDNNVICFSI